MNKEEQYKVYSKVNNPYLYKLIPKNTKRHSKWTK